MGSISLLIVDDHQIFLEGLRRILEAQEGLRIVGEADTVAGAVEQAEALQPDLVLLDLGLKDGSGLNALPRLLAAAPETRVLVLSGYGPENALPALRLGARGFVSKDTASSHLLNAIRTVMQGEIWAEHQTMGKLVDALFRSHQADRAEDSLTPRERDVLRLVGQGQRNPAIARALAISESTVKAHVSSLMRKLKIEDRLRLTLHAARTTGADR